MNYIDVDVGEVSPNPNWVMLIDTCMFSFDLE